MRSCPTVCGVDQKTILSVCTFANEDAGLLLAGNSFAEQISLAGFLHGIVGLDIQQCANAIPNADASLATSAMEASPDLKCRFRIGFALVVVIVPVTIIGDQDGMWNRTAWKTDAFYGNPLTGFIAGP